MSYLELMIKVMNTMSEDNFRELDTMVEILNHRYDRARTPGDFQTIWVLLDSFKDIIFLWEDTAFMGATEVLGAWQRENMEGEVL